MRVLFAERLQLLRKEFNYKQSDLADKLGTTQRRISYLESGKVEPDLQTLIQLATLFGVSVDYLIGYKDY